MQAPVGADVGTGAEAGAGAGAETGAETGAESRSSSRIQRLNVVGTAVFVVSAVAAAVVFTKPIRLVGVVVALVLFAVGVFCFLWSYWTAVQRSRTDNIAVSQLYFLSGTSTPPQVKRVMNAALLVQVVTCLATAIARSSTDGRPGSTLAFGILVPMFGLGLNGLWCANHGTFSPRQQEPAPISPSVPPSTDEIEQNSSHG
ncbi:MAG: hypothetical protein F2789_11200 [Actinobacteria bacterium]|nr:hypothetical protein [Actinomycetota bacterium]